MKPSLSQIKLESMPGLPFWQELYVVREWLNLKTSTVFQGDELKHGQQQPIVIVPGFLSTNFYLAELYEWLKRINYKPYYSGIRWNINCPDYSLQVLLNTIQTVYQENNQPLSLIGHSLGGAIARAAAVQKPELIKQIITLGSPINAARVHPTILATVKLLKKFQRKRLLFPNCYTEKCQCRFITSLSTDLPALVEGAAIYSKQDGIIDWHCCLDNNKNLNIEVKSTHLGMVYNVEVYRTIASLLSASNRINI